MFTRSSPSGMDLSLANAASVGANTVKDAEESSRTATQEGTHGEDAHESSVDKS